jgi:hypothetical protein
MNNSSDSFSFSVVEINKGLAILRVINPRNAAFVCYQLGYGGRTFQTLRAARTSARRILSRQP